MEIPPRCIRGIADIGQIGTTGMRRQDQPGRPQERVDLRGRAGVRRAGAKEQVRELFAGGERPPPGGPRQHIVHEPFEVLVVLLGRVGPVPVGPRVKVEQALRVEPEGLDGEPRRELRQ